jgi:hypothetical protein
MQVQLSSQIQSQSEAHPEIPEGSSRLNESLEGPFRTKKGRKNDGLGVFSKLLAGLLRKKDPGPGLKTQTASSEEAVSANPGVKKTDLKNKVRAEKGTLKKDGAELLSARKAEKSPRQIVEKDRGAAAEIFLARALDAEKQETLSGLAGFSNHSDLSDEALREAPGEGGTSLSGIEGKLKKTVKEDGKSPASETFFDGAEGKELSAAADWDNQGISRQMREEGRQSGETRTGDKVREKRKERAVAEVRDLRTGTGAEAAASLGLKAVEEVRQGGEGEMVFELRPLSSESGNSGSSEGAGISRGAESFENILARELGGELSSDIVKQAAIVLRDGGAGTIRLSLRPETLGNVKIRLEMADNKIAGHIIVESDEALRAFEREIHTLEQAFEDSGFENAKLDLALDSRSGGQQGKGDEARPFFSERFAASHYDQSLSGLEAAASGGYASAFGISAINMFA